MKSKVVSLDELPQRIGELGASARKVVATNGCFDLLHVGHIRYLQAARELGDVLVVGVNGDASTRALKGESRPLNSEADRAEVLAALACVDLVAIFPEVRATRFLTAAHPNVYVKGGDYQPETLDAEERAVLKRIGAEIRIIGFEAGYSTSGIVARMVPNK